MSNKQLSKDNNRVNDILCRVRLWQALFDWQSNWNNCDYKYCIYYSHNDNKIAVKAVIPQRSLGEIAFSSEEKANEAIETFKSDLMWYFTEYHQKSDVLTSLRGGLSYGYRTFY